MPPLFGVLASPTVLLNALLSFGRDGSLPVRGPDTVAVVTPMFNEEAGAAKALTSLLTQSEPLDEIAISVNGGSDATLAEGERTLRDHGLEPGDRQPLEPFSAVVQRWHRPTGAGRVIVVNHHQPTSKADSVNIAVLSKLVTARRILVVDGDTVLDAGFVAAMKDGFYRLRSVRAASGSERRASVRYVLEDHAILSGSVRPRRPGGGGLAAWWIWLARMGEYAAAAVLRSGQTRRFTRSGPFSGSRLFTVVGCGFVARRETFPMPSDTRTEDHDFTLHVQNLGERRGRVSARSLDERGFRVKVDGAWLPFSTHLGSDTELTAVNGPNARFVDEAVMYTDDPRAVGGLVRQLERWNGGAVESAFKRLADEASRRRLSPNVRFTLASALVENALGLSMLLLIPTLLGLRHGLLWSDRLATGLTAWLALDFLGLVALTALGFVRAAIHGLPTGPAASGGAHGGRATARRRMMAAITALPRAVVVAVPLQSLRLVNSVSYVAAATRVLPSLLRARPALGAQRRHERFPPPEPTPNPARRPGITWERPTALVTRAAYGRTAGTAVVLALVALTAFAGSALVASSVTRHDRSAWRLTYASVRVDKAAHELLPILEPQADGWNSPGPAATVFVTGTVAWHGAGTGQAGAGRASGVGPVRALGPLAPLEFGAGLSPYCSPRLLPPGTAGQRHVHGAGAAAYAPLSDFGLLMLARLVPLLAHLEEAAGAYDVDADLLLKVILNESYLDPLAVGPTDDLGLAQVTSDSLTLLRSVSLETGSKFYNTSLITDDFSVFDPAFSLCAGAAKLAWAVSEAGGESEDVAYARYVNPVAGVVRGNVAETHVAAVAALTALTPLTDRLGSAVAAYRADATGVTEEERSLLDVASAVRSGLLTLPEAYQRTALLVRSLRILDSELYDTVLDRLYGVPEIGTIFATGPEMNDSSSSP